MILTSCSRDIEIINYQFIRFDKNENLCTEHQHFLHQIPDSVMINGKYVIYKREISLIDDFCKNNNCFQTIEAISKRYKVINKYLFYHEYPNQINIIGLRLDFVYSKREILQVDFCFKKEEYVKISKHHFIKNSQSTKSITKDIEEILTKINNFHIHQYLIIDGI